MLLLCAYFLCIISLNFLWVTINQRFFELSFYIWISDSIFRLFLSDIIQREVINLSNFRYLYKSNIKHHVNSHNFNLYSFLSWYHYHLWIYIIVVISLYFVYKVFETIFVIICMIMLLLVCLNRKIHIKVTLQMIYTSFW